MRTKQQILDDIGIQNPQRKQAVLDAMEEYANNRILSECTRVEVIDNTGRAYTNYACKVVETQMQDDNRTLKVFINE